jgi:hypothetical protein
LLYRIFLYRTVSVKYMCFELTYILLLKTYICQRRVVLFLNREWSRESYLKRLTLPLDVNLIIVFWCTFVLQNNASYAKQTRCALQQVPRF